ncbi:drug/metabolite transporter (DMT)-like permease [Streptacidiphilus sp. MAP12-20]|uniref:DMT family transporter n=1 Tax=Streptacidiphilus sp. MAP12-20 TaxID=3156299 RepID=UPI003511382A
MKAHDSAIASRPIAVNTAGTLQAFGAVALFSLSFPATNWALRGFGPWSTVGLRGVLAALLAGVCLALSGARLPARRLWPGLLVVGAGCVVGFPVLTTLALQTSTTAHSAVVIGLLPLATAACAALRGRNGQPRRFWAAAGAGASVVVAFALLQHGGAPSRADLYLFGALLLCAAGYAEGGRLARELPGWQVIAWAVLAALPATALTTALTLPREPVHVTGHAVVGVLYLAGISQFGGFVLWYRGMAAIGVPRASQLQLAQPLLTLVWAALLLDEPIPAAAPVAALLVLASIAATQRTARRAPTAAPETALERSSLGVGRPGDQRVLR